MNIYEVFKNNNYQFNEAIIAKLCMIGFDSKKLESIRTVVEFWKMDVRSFYITLFPKGTKIELVRIDPEEKNYHSGMKGTITNVDDAGQIHVDWDEGGSLAISFEYGDEFVLA